MHTIRLIYASDAREDLRYRDFMSIMDKADDIARHAQAFASALVQGG